MTIPSAGKDVELLELSYIAYILAGMLATAANLENILVALYEI